MSTARDEVVKSDEVVEGETFDPISLLTDRELLEGIYRELLALNDLRSRIETTVPVAIESLQNNPLLSGVARILGKAFR